MPYILKTRSGTFVPGLGIVSIPTYVGRDNTREAWVLNRQNFPDAERHYFYDHLYGNCGNALREAIAALREAQYGKDLLVGRLLPTQERYTKKIKLGHVGICHFVSVVNRREVHYFGVNQPAVHITKNVYIGNENTWMYNYDEKLAEAIDLREAAEREYYRKHYWKGLYELPEEA